MLPHKHFSSPKTGRLRPTNRHFHGTVAVVLWRGQKNKSDSNQLQFHPKWLHKQSFLLSPGVKNPPLWRLMVAYLNISVHVKKKGEKKQNKPPLIIMAAAASVLLPASLADITLNYASFVWLLLFLVK